MARVLNFDGEDVTLDGPRLCERQAVAKLQSMGFEYRGPATGWVVPFSKAEIPPWDYVARDAEEWGGALNDTAWDLAVTIQHHTKQATPALLFNHSKAIVRDLILRYLRLRYERMVNREG